MLSDFIYQKLQSYLPFTPTNDQKEAMQAISGFLSSSNEVFVLKGYAGTGKTSLIQSIVLSLQELNINTFLMAPTGRAAKVLQQYTKKPAFTVHKKIYRQNTSAGFDRFTLNFNATANAVFIIDEASMISNDSPEQSIFGSGRLLDDIFLFVCNDKKCKIIFIGDTAQLPPVGTTESPALDRDYLSHTFLKNIEESMLTEVVRQQAKSGIITNATEIRKLISNNIQISALPRLLHTQDVVSVPGNELLEMLEQSHSTVGVEDTIVITRSNKLANRYNEGIRRAILWRESILSVGDVIMVVKNNYYWVEKIADIDFIANGDIARIVSIGKYEDLYGFHFVNATIQLLDYNATELDVKILLDTLETEAPALTKVQSNALYTEVKADYADITNKRKVYELMKQNEYFNALQIKFAYAVTCHKAQGGQWKHVYIDHGYLPENTVSLEFLRWLYTAFTRATEKVFLVNFKKEFFEDEILL